MSAWPRNRRSVLCPSPARAAGRSGGRGPARHPHHQDPPHLHARTPGLPADPGKDVLVHEREEPPAENLVRIEMLEPDDSGSDGNALRRTLPATHPVQNSANASDAVRDLPMPFRVPQQFPNCTCHRTTTPVPRSGRKPQVLVPGCQESMFERNRYASAAYRLTLCGPHCLSHAICQLRRCRDS